MKIRKREVFLRRNEKIEANLRLVGMNCSLVVGLLT